MFDGIFGIGPFELMLILVIALIVIGPERLPGLARNAGQKISSFRKEAEGLRREFLSSVDEVRGPLEELRAPLNEVRSALYGVQDEGRKVVDELRSSFALPRPTPIDVSDYEVAADSQTFSLPVLKPSGAPQPVRGAALATAKSAQLDPPAQQGRGGVVTPSSLAEGGWGEGGSGTTSEATPAASQPNGFERPVRPTSRVVRRPRPRPLPSELEPATIEPSSTPNLTLVEPAFTPAPIPPPAAMDSNSNGRQPAIKGKAADDDILTMLGSNVGLMEGDVAEASHR